MNIFKLMASLEVYPGGLGEGELAKINAGHTAVESLLDAGMVRKTTIQAGGTRVTDYEIVAPLDQCRAIASAAMLLARMGHHT